MQKSQLIYYNDPQNTVEKTTTESHTALEHTVFRINAHNKKLVPVVQH